MAGCIDKRFESLLYPYELGMLSDEDREAVEKHHLECDHCFERAKRFREAARLLQVDPTVRQSIRQMDENYVSAEEKALPDRQMPATKSKIWSPWVKTSLAAAVVLIILVLQPWKIEITPRQEAVAAENLLAVMYFSNLADPADSQRLGEIMANLLVTDLSESPNIQVVSSERLYDILKLLGQDKSETADESVAFRVAEKANARWMLTGNILQTAPVYILTSRLIDVASGNIISTQKISGDSGMTIFVLADSLSSQIRKELPLRAPAATAEPDRMVADMTTHSQEAFAYYLEGVDYYRKIYNIEAVKSFEKALEYDSTFAMVYYYLAILKDCTLLDEAVKYSVKATRKDRYYIEGLQALWAKNVPLAMSIYQQLIDNYPLEKQANYTVATLQFNLGKYEEAIGRLNAVIALDSLFGNAYNLLSYSYSRLGDLDHALEINNKSILLEPNEPNSYDTRGEIFVRFKMYDGAIESFRKALEKKPDFYPSWKNLGNVYTYLGDFIRAESCFQVIASVEDIYVWTDGKILLAQNLIYQGKYGQALAVLVDGSREDRKAHGQEIYPSYWHLAALIHENSGDFDLALEDIAKAREIAQRVYPQNKIYWRRNYARILAEAGNVDSARAISEKLKVALEEAARKIGDYWYSLGMINRVEGRLVDAEANLRKATIETDSFDYSAHFMLGQVLLELNQSDEAIEQFNKLLEYQKEHPEEWASWEADAYYYLGLAYQQSGKSRKAIENFTEYLNIRKNADSQIESVIDARRRQAALINESSS